MIFQPTASRNKGSELDRCGSIKHQNSFRREYRDYYLVRSKTSLPEGSYYERKAGAEPFSHNVPL